MNDARWIWYAGLFIASITINTALLRVITDDKLPRPNWAALFINALLAFVGGIFCYVFVGIVPSIFFVLFDLLSFLVLVCMVERRDVHAVRLGEKLLVEFQTIDMQICYILSEIYSNAGGDLAKPIRQTLRYILSELANLLDLDSVHHSQLCVLVPDNFQFRVVAYEGIASFKLKEMEEKFRYGDEPISLAGHAMNRRIPIIINDLANEKDIDTKYWIKISQDETKEGSILVYPIIRGIGPGKSDPIALLSITSRRRNAFDVETTKQLLSYFSSKIEILQNCLDIVDGLKKD